MSLLPSLSTLSRSFTICKPRMLSLRFRAGQNFRLNNNLPRSGNETGPLHDFHDYHFIGTSSRTIFSPIDIA